MTRKHRTAKHIPARRHASRLAGPEREGGKAGLIYHQIVDSAPSLPSQHLALALSILRLEHMDALRIARAAKAADRFQKAQCPGRPNVTMAAYVRLSMPYIDGDGNIIIDRTLKEIARAFDCGESAVRERTTLIRTREG